MFFSELFTNLLKNSAELFTAFLILCNVIRKGVFKIRTNVTFETTTTTTTTTTFILLIAFLPRVAAGALFAIYFLLQVAFLLIIHSRQFCDRNK